MRIIIFDLDHTLLKANVSFRFGFYLYQHNKMSLSDLLFCLTAYMRHKWWGLSLFSLHTLSFDRLFKHQSALEFHALAEQFLNENFEKFLYFPVIERLKLAQKRGDEVFILSSSPDFLVGKIAERLNVRNWGSTVYKENEKGEFISIEKIMEGQDKVDYVKRLVEEKNISPLEVTAYSDSYLDLPILEFAGEAIGVTPDVQLKKICLQRKWEIL